LANSYQILQVLNSGATYKDQAEQLKSLLSMPNIVQARGYVAGFHNTPLELASSDDYERGKSAGRVFRSKYVESNVPDVTSD